MTQPTNAPSQATLPLAPKFGLDAVLIDAVDNRRRFARQSFEAVSQWKSRFDRHDIEYVICESDAPLRQLLLQEGTFRLVFDDGMHSVMLRGIEKHQSIIN